MSMALATRFVLAFTIGLTGLCVYIVARLRGPTQLFFMDLGRELTDADHARARRVETVAALAVGGGIAGVFTVSDPTVLLALALVCPLVPVVWLVCEMLAAARTTELAPVPERYESLDRPPRAWEYASAPLQLLNVAAIAAGSAAVAWIIDRLPERIPMQWDAVGQVARWGSPAEHWVMLPVLLFDTLLMWGIIASLARERWALPPENQERCAALQRRRRTLNVRLLEWIIVGIDVGLVVMWVLLAAGGLPGRGGLAGTGIVAGLALIAAATVAPLAAYLPKLLRVAEEIKELAGTPVLGTRSDGWRWGGLIYYAPDDPAVLVPKRLGIGQTLNFARPGAWVFLGALVGVPIALVILVLILI